MGENFRSDESAFNFASKYLEEISESLKMCKQYSTLGHEQGWLSWLRATYRELSAKTNDTEDEDFDNSFREINKLMNDPESRIENRTYIFYLLDKLETKIRKKLQQKGMLLPSKDDPRYAVLQR